MHRFSDYYGWFREYRPVLLIACRYAAIARKIPSTVLISMHSYLVRSLRDSFQPLLGACIVEQRSLRDLATVLITEPCRHDSSSVYYVYGGGTFVDSPQLPGNHEFHA